MKKIFALTLLLLISAPFAIGCDDLGNYPNTQMPELNCQNYTNQKGYSYFRWVDNGNNTTECYGCINKDDDNLPQIYTPGGLASQQAASAAPVSSPAPTPSSSPSPSSAPVTSAH